MSLTVDIDMTEASILLQVGEGDTRVRQRCMRISPFQFQDWKTTLIQSAVPPTRMAKRKQSVRDQSLLLLSQHPAGSLMNTTG